MPIIIEQLNEIAMNEKYWTIIVQNADFELQNKNKYQNRQVTLKMAQYVYLH